MITFREIPHEFGPPAVHWRIEWYDDDEAHRHFPYGTAYVRIPEGRPAQLDFVLVGDDWRRRGIAKALLHAAHERWSDLQMSPAMMLAGESLLREGGGVYRD